VVDRATTPWVLPEDASDRRVSMPFLEEGEMSAHVAFDAAKADRTNATPVIWRG